MKKFIPIIILGLIFLSGTAFATSPALLSITESATAPVTPATAEGYIYALSSDSKLYFKSDAGTAYDLTSGTAAWDDITDPDANNEIDFTDYISELKLGASGDFRIGDGGSNYIKFGASGDTTFIGIASLAVPNESNPTVDAIGELALATSGEGSLLDTPLLEFYDGSNVQVVPSVDITEVSGMSDNDVVAFNAATSTWTIQAQAGGAAALPDQMVAYTALSLLVPMASDPVTAIAPNDYVNCAANIQIPCINFDDSTEWARNFIIPIHEDFDTTSNISFEVHGMPYTAPATAKNVAFKIYWVTVGSGDLYSSATTSSETADIAVSTTQASGDVLSFQINNTTLGWSPRDMVYCQISRIDADAYDLTGHFQATALIVYLKRS